MVRRSPSIVKSGNNQSNVDWQAVISNAYFSWNMSGKIFHEIDVIDFWNYPYLYKIIKYKYKSILVNLYIHDR